MLDKCRVCGGDDLALLSRARKLIDASGYHWAKETLRCEACKTIDFDYVVTRKPVENAHAVRESILDYLHKKQAIVRGEYNGGD
jgi:hypothetical protein